MITSIEAQHIIIETSRDIRLAPVFCNLNFHQHVKTTTYGKWTAAFNFPLYF